MKMKYRCTSASKPGTETPSRANSTHRRDIDVKRERGRIRRCHTQGLPPRRLLRRASCRLRSPLRTLFSPLEAAIIQHIDGSAFDCDRERKRGATLAQNLYLRFLIFWVQSDQLIVGMRDPDTRGIVQITPPKISRLRLRYLLRLLRPRLQRR